MYLKDKMQPDAYDYRRLAQQLNQLKFADDRETITTLLATLQHTGYQLSLNDLAPVVTAPVHRTLVEIITNDYPYAATRGPEVLNKLNCLTVRRTAESGGSADFYLVTEIYQQAVHNLLVSEIKNVQTLAQMVGRCLRNQNRYAAGRRRLRDANAADQARAHALAVLDERTLLHAESTKLSDLSPFATAVVKNAAIINGATSADHERKTTVKFMRKALRNDVYDFEQSNADLNALALGTSAASASMLLSIMQNTRCPFSLGDLATVVGARTYHQIFEQVRQQHLLLDASLPFDNLPQNQSRPPRQAMLLGIVRTANLADADAFNVVEHNYATQIYGTLHGTDITNVTALEQIVYQNLQNKQNHNALTSGVPDAILPALEQTHAHALAVLGERALVRDARSQKLTRLNSVMVNPTYGIIADRERE